MKIYLSSFDHAITDTQGRSIRVSAIDSTYAEILVCANGGNQEYVVLQEHGAEQRTTNGRDVVWRDGKWVKR